MDGIECFWNNLWPDIITQDFYLVKPTYTSTYFVMVSDLGYIQLRALLS